jgi:hypothetical protein
MDRALSTVGVMNNSRQMAKWAFHREMPLIPGAQNETLSGLCSRAPGP